MYVFVCMDMYVFVHEGVCMYVCMYVFGVVCICVSMVVFICLCCTYAYVYIYSNRHMYVCMYVCMFVYSTIHKNKEKTKYNRSCIFYIKIFWFNLESVLSNQQIIKQNKIKNINQIKKNVTYRF